MANTCLGDPSGGAEIQAWETLPVSKNPLALLHCHPHGLQSCQKGQGRNEPKTDSDGKALGWKGGGVGWRGAQALPTAGLLKMKGAARVGVPPCPFTLCDFTGCFRCSSPWGPVGGKCWAELYDSTGQ